MDVKIKSSQMMVSLAHPIAPVGQICGGVYIYEVTGAPTHQDALVWFGRAIIAPSAKRFVYSFDELRAHGKSGEPIRS